MVERPIRDVRSQDVPVEDVKWLMYEPPIPLRGLTLIVGFRGTSKTTLAAWLTAQVTRAEGEVLFVSQEDDYSEFIRPRLIAAGADERHLRFPDPDDPLLWLPRDADKLTRYVAERRTRLVILDPLSSLMSIGSVDRVRAALTPLARMSRELDCAVVGFHHFLKGGGTTVAAAIGGSGALQDIVRALYVFGPEPPPSLTGGDVMAALMAAALGAAPESEQHGTRRVLAPEKLSAAPMPESLSFLLSETTIEGMQGSVPYLTVEGIASWSAAEVLAGGNGQATPKRDSAVSDALSFLVDLLAEGPQWVLELQRQAKEAGLSWRSVERARQKLGDAITPERQTGRDGRSAWRWKLTETPDTLPEGWSA